MSWASSLYNLYETNSWRAGEVEDWNGRQLMLLPVCHTTVNAQIEVFIDSSGSFLYARTLGKKEPSETIAPATEKSSSRTSTAAAPHPLFDSLRYVAGDFLERVAFESVSEKKEQGEKAKIEKGFTDYLAFLGEWCNSAYSHPKVCAVHSYVSKKALMSDLIKQGNIIKTNEEGRAPLEQKINGVELKKAVVRFRVMTSTPSLPEEMLRDSVKSSGSDIWLDKSVQQSYANFYFSRLSMTDLCYLSGKRTVVAAFHPKQIRFNGDGAKLFSANDDLNFTYRGRFKTKDKDSGYNESVSIGYETSQKIHNALKWIIRRQGYLKDGVCIVVWENALNCIPEFYQSAAYIIEQTTAEEEAIDESKAWLLGQEEQETGETNYAAAKDFNAAIDGYSAKLGDQSNMVIIALASAGPGRLALTYFKELETSTYLKNIRLWHESCLWRHEYYKGIKFCQYEGMASLSETARALYGRERRESNGSKRLELRTIGERDNQKAPMLISTYERLRPCIIENARVPYDMVRSAVLKASNPLAYESSFLYLRVLHIACSLVKRHYWEKGAIYGMELDTTCNNRSYLFGRLLAVAEKIERSTYNREENRYTNAERYMQQFAQTPFRTWLIIRKSICPYLLKHNLIVRDKYKDLLGEIEMMFLDGDFESKEALDGRFLLGYDSQRCALKSREKDRLNANAKNIDEDNKTED